MEQQQRGHFFSDSFVMIGLYLTITYFIIDFIMTALKTDKATGLEEMVGTDLDQYWMKIIIICLFAIFGSHIHYSIKERKKAEARMAKDAATRARFKRLLSPNLANLIDSGELKVEQGGKETMATILFVDIRGFTSISEKAEASELLSLLNEYYERFVEVTFHHEGTVDKFIGDGMMVIWGTPLVHADDPARAIRAALDMQKVLADFNEESVNLGRPELEIGIGINTGKVVAGCIGSSQTMSYSVIGDTVNIASHLCSAAKSGQILISESTWKCVKCFFEAEELKPIKLKTRGEKVKVFAVRQKKILFDTTKLN